MKAIRTNIQTKEVQTEEVNGFAEAFAYCTKIAQAESEKGNIGKLTTIGTRKFYMSIISPKGVVLETVVIE